MSNSIAVMTEPECLGPCEPGTGVLLDAVIWHESDSGMLVVNVMWKGTNYIGTLLQSSIHKWAPPSFKPGSPVAESDTNVQASPQKRKTRRGGRSTAKKPPHPVVYSSPRTWGADFKPHKGLDPTAESIRPEKRARCDIECPEQKCSKKFRCQNALEYHRIHAHVPNEIASLKQGHNQKASSGSAGSMVGKCSKEIQTCFDELMSLAVLKEANNATVVGSSVNPSVAAATPNNGSVPVNGHIPNPTNSTAQSPFKSTILTNQDNKVALGIPKDSTGLMTNKVVSEEVAKVCPQTANHIAPTASAMSKRSNPTLHQSPVQSKNSVTPFKQSAGSLGGEGTNTNLNSKLSGSGDNSPSATKNLGMFPGSMRPVLSSKIDTAPKKVSAPVAVLRPLVPQHVAAHRTNTDKTLASITTPTHTLTISSSQPQYRAVMPTVSGSTVISTSASTLSGHTKVNTSSGSVKSPAHAHMTSQRSHDSSGSSLSLHHRRDSGKSRGSRSNSVHSPNYSDISDASDADMDTCQGEDREKRAATGCNSAETPERKSDMAQSAEEKLYCNEELPSPSHTPGEKEGSGNQNTDDTSRMSPLKSPAINATSRQTPRSSPAVVNRPPVSSPHVDSRHSVPLHAVPPPQHIMYPYFPFMPNSQMGPVVSLSGGAPVYTHHPYFMTYQGVPFMPPQGPPGPGFPHHMGPCQPFLAGMPSHQPRGSPNNNFSLNNLLN